MPLTFPSIGSISCHTINGIAHPGKADTSEFKQFGQDGVGLVIGPKRQPVSTLVSKSFLANRTAADTAKIAAMALIGTSVTVIRDAYSGSPVTITTCVIKDVKVTKDEAATSLYGAWQLDLSWELYTPIDW